MTFAAISWLAIVVGCGGQVAAAGDERRSAVSPEAAADATVDAASTSHVDGTAIDAAPSADSAADDSGCSASGSPITLATVDAEAEAIAVDATNVYFNVAALDSTGTGPHAAIMSVPKSGGATTVLASSPSGSSWSASLAVDSTSVYWTDGNRLLSVPLGGGTATTLAWPPDDSGLPCGASACTAAGLVVNEASYFWAWTFRYDPKRGPEVGNAVQLARGSGVATTVATEDYGFSALAVDSSYVYIAGANGIPRVPIGGGPVTMLVENQTIWGIAVDATNVYWIAWGGGVMQMPKGGGPSLALASGTFYPPKGGLVVDATSVYWLSASGPGSVMKVPIGGGAVTTYACAQDSPGAIAVDDANLYFTDMLAGTVKKVALR